ncbi:beta-L-arabinofuranosidase domain-containing protein [Rathayibacter sp. VKM Ac-2760]|uniref:glycoside hydrolase family 127 protein n=1 Tax=Rathayibacter sp. VKM Ac-2760 TaxID=2609253 RepID=UPI001316C9A8|nr:beta-L-arabinofuranosidase domain-containing protein [Rathayibacter sp. VKM Ac-2760]QHC58790.1 glycoside hydrolase family 127 protein [Rathayibacter sp. VKM Ac-2760]
MNDTTPLTGGAPVPLRDVSIDDAFWSPRIETVRRETIPFQYHQLETVGHLHALQNEPREGDPVPHIFWDSDVAKWIEAASYSLIAVPDAELDARLDSVIAILAAAQGADGYLNTYFTVVAPEERWTDLRDAHELYCAGHLIEAGVAHHAATGKTTLLDVVRRYADLIGRTFGRGPGQIRGYDGHEEIELALVKLAHATEDDSYLDLASYFVEERGREPYFFDEEAARRGTPGWFGDHFPGADHPGRRREYVQAHAPVREQTEAVGHAVRAMYLYSAMADLARERGDDSLLEACRTLWTHLTTRRMYVTGGIGTSAVNEGFTTDFDLPDETAYAETCAAIGLMMWAQRMLRLERHRRYGDVMELALYNGVLAGLSRDGRCFFYDNPLASQGGVGRHDWFEVACCPPNIARLLTSLGSYAFATSDRALVVHLAISASVQVPAGGSVARVTVAADVLGTGRVRIRVDRAPEGPFSVSLRVPGWSAHSVLTLVGSDVEAGETYAATEDGYATATRVWRDGDEVELLLTRAPRRLRPDPRLIDHAGQVAVAHGPLIYALEETDNGTDLHLRALAIDTPVLEAPALSDLHAARLTADGTAWTVPGDGLYRVDEPETTPTTLVFSPYYDWANRGRGEMRVWLHETL